jgi:hypothetical protein
MSRRVESSVPARSELLRSGEDAVMIAGAGGSHMQVRIRLIANGSGNGRAGL